jgi:hypothetical protein
MGKKSKHARKHSKRNIYASKDSSEKPKKNYTYDSEEESVWTPSVRFTRINKILGHLSSVHKN